MSFKGFMAQAASVGACQFRKRALVKLFPLVAYSSHTKPRHKYCSAQKSNQPKQDNKDLCGSVLMLTYD